nr:MAG TPA: Copper binding octapeptide repeat protein [Caudoviricetes sp.]
MLYKQVQALAAQRVAAPLQRYYSMRRAGAIRQTGLHGGGWVQ